MENENEELNQNQATEIPVVTPEPVEIPITREQPFNNEQIQAINNTTSQTTEIPITRDVPFAENQKVEASPTPSIPVQNLNQAPQSDVPKDIPITREASVEVPKQEVSVQESVQEVSQQAQVKEPVQEEKSKGGNLFIIIIVLIIGGFIYLLPNLDNISSNLKGTINSLMGNTKKEETKKEPNVLEEINKRIDNTTAMIELKNNNQVTTKYENKTLTITVNSKDYKITLNEKKFNFTVSKGNETDELVLYAVLDGLYQYHGYNKGAVEVLKTATKEELNLIGINIISETNQELVYSIDTSTKYTLPNQRNYLVKSDFDEKTIELLKNDGSFDFSIGNLVIIKNGKNPINILLLEPNKISDNTYKSILTIAEVYLNEDYIDFLNNYKTLETKKVGKFDIELDATLTQDEVLEYGINNMQATRIKIGG